MSKDFGDIQERYQILSGDSSVLTADTAGKSHINAAYSDIARAYPFTWLRATATTALSSGTITLPSTYYPGFRIEYARIVGGEELVEKDARGMQDEGSNGYNITYTPSTDTYTFTCQTTTGSILYYYTAIPTALTLDADLCIVPDFEAVAYLAASKNWIGSERNTGLKNEYQTEADKRIKAMIQQDAAYGPVLEEGNLASYNLNGY